MAATFRHTDLTVIALSPPDRAAAGLFRNPHAQSPCYPKPMPNNEASARTRSSLPGAQRARALACLMLLAAFAAPVRAGTGKIAVAGPAEGTYAPMVQAMAEGARAAALMLNGLGERGSDVKTPAAPVAETLHEVSVKDDGCDAHKAEEAARTIVAENFDLVLGHPCPKAALAAAKIYGAAGITFIATETRHPRLTQERAGPSVFRLSGRDDAQGEEAARYLAQSHGTGPVAIVHDRTLYAKTIAEQATAALKAAKVETIAATIVSGDKEYGKLIAKIKDAGAVFFAGFPMEAGFILKELRAAGSSAPFLASDAVATSEFTASFPDVAKDAAVLRAAGIGAGSGRTQAAAAAAVRLYAQAARMAMGPAADAAGWRALANDALARTRSPAFPASGVEVISGPLVISSGRGPTTFTDLHDIVFSAAGNASVDSFDLVRWDGVRWVRVSALR